jgi:hypothetical protein
MFEIELGDLKEGIGKEWPGGGRKGGGWRI